MWLLYVPFVVCLTYFTYNRYFHPLSKIPGPFLASITPFWLAYQAYRGRRPRLDIQLHAKYGSVVRITPNEIIFSNPDYFKTVYGAGNAKKFKKSRFYEAPTDTLQPENWDKLDMLPEKNIEKLQIQKRFAGVIYSEKNAKRHELFIDNNLNRMLKRWRTLVDRPLDIYYELEIANVDIMSEFTFGETFGAVETGSDGGHMATMDKMWAYWGWVGVLPWLNELDKKLAPWAMLFGPNVASILPVFPWIWGKTVEYDKAAEEGKKPKPCLLDDLRNLTKEKPEFRKNWGTMLSLTNLGAGVDTMSWTEAAIIVGIGQNPDVYANLRAEIERALQDGRLQKNEPVPYDAAMKLPYLQACMSEAMRLWPNIAISLARIVPPEGIEIDGYFIPGGYNVGMNSRVLGYNEEVFGSEPRKFRPERWLDKAVAKREIMESRNLAFGGPSRKCPGLHVAWLAMSKVLATLFVNFDVKILNELDGEAGPGGHVWREFGSFPTKWHGLEVEISAR